MLRLSVCTARLWPATSTFALLWLSNVSAQPPSEMGQWSAAVPLSDPNYPGRCYATHSILLRTGKVLCIDQTNEQFTPNRPDVVLVDPIAGAVSLVLGERQIGDHWMFCAGHCVLSDGRAYIAGGGIPCNVDPFGSVAWKSTIFDPIVAESDPQAALTAGPDEEWCYAPAPCGSF